MAWWLLVIGMSYLQQHQHLIRNIIIEIRGEASHAQALDVMPQALELPLKRMTDVSSLLQRRMRRGTCSRC
jgi:hypothetical protein